MSQMDSVQRVNVADMDCVVQPGITWQNLNKELKQHGLFFAVDPGPGASIGGMVRWCECAVPNESGAYVPRCLFIGILGWIIYKVATGCSGTNAVR